MHKRPLSFLGIGTYGLLNGTAGRFQTGVAAILLLSRTTFFLPLLLLLLLPPELLLPLALIPLPPHPTLVVAANGLDLLVGDESRGFLSPPPTTTSPPAMSSCEEGVREDTTLFFGLAEHEKSALISATRLLGRVAVAVAVVVAVVVVRG